MEVWEIEWPGILSNANVCGVVAISCGGSTAWMGEGEVGGHGAGGGSDGGRVEG